jgi:hypothetical protein
VERAKKQRGKSNRQEKRKNVTATKQRKNRTFFVVDAAVAATGANVVSGGELCGASGILHRLHRAPRGRARSVAHLVAVAPASIFASLALDRHGDRIDLTAMRATCE